MHWDFTERAGAQQLRPFDYLAFRYLEVDGAAETLDGSRVTIAARHTDFPDEHAASFATSDPRIDAVWNLARHSALYDAQEQFLDTPTREQGPFLTDSYDVSQAAMAAFGERMVTAQMLTGFAHSQRRYWPDGRVNAVYPNGDGKRDIPDYTEDYVQWVWKYWMASGDRTQLAALYPVVRNITGYLANAIDPQTGLVTNLPGGGGDYAGGMVDWPPQMRYGYDMSTTARTTLNIVAVDDFRRVAAIAQTLGRPASESAALTVRADALTSAIRKLLERPDGVFVDGLLANGRPSAHASQQANAFALGFGIVSAAHVPRVVAQVVRAKSAMGVINYAVLLDALHDGGRDDALVDRSHRSEPARVRADPERGRDVHVGELGRAPDRRQRVARLGHDGAVGPAGRRARRPGDGDRAARRSPSPRRSRRSPGRPGSSRPNGGRLRSPGLARPAAAKRSTSRCPRT